MGRQLELFPVHFTSLKAEVKGLQEEKETQGIRARLKPPDYFFLFTNIEHIMQGDLSPLAPSFTYLYEG